MQFKGIIFNLTYDCSLRCAHCFYYPQPASRGAFAVERIGEIIESMRTIAPVKEAHFTGGEPFLYFDRLVEMVDLVRQLGATRITCSTNCFWADDLDKTRMYLSRLKNAGLTWFLISADAFHQESVALENVLTASQARLELGLQGNDDLSVVTMIDADFDHPFNLKTRKIVHAIQARGHGASMHSSMPYGRGHELVPKNECRMAHATLKCWEFRTWSFIQPEGPRTVIIGPDENVMICYGVSLGNLRSNSLPELLRSYEESPNQIVRALLDKGAEGLAALAQQYGWEREPYYQNECHLCYCARDYLRRFEPEFLQPDECYPDWTRLQAEPISQKIVAPVQDTTHA
jgi:hypothetical protein